MRLLGHALLWWGLIAGLLVFTFGVWFLAGYFCCADRWCERAKTVTKRRQV
jgi:hypothetical protein